MSGERFKPSPLTIGIRDSGVGGLTVARCIKEVLPAARLLYFADTAHVPYGERTPEEVRHYALSISQFLIEQGASILVFACNTSSALALGKARATFTVPIIGTIEPGARAAIEVSRNGRIGVLATRATVESGVYTQWLKKFNPAIEALEVACPEFVPLVESERTETPEARNAAARYLAPLREFGADTVILGCTHYPLLLPALREAAPDMVFVDPATAVACEVKKAAEEHFPDDKAFSGPGDTFFASGPAEGVAHWIHRLLPQSASLVQPGPVFDL